MISDKMTAALNEQIAMEGYASFLYLSMASWCDRQGLAGCATFLHRQSDEERQHMLRLFNFLSEVDGHALSPGIEQPPHHFDSVQSLFETVYTHEQKVTASINQLIEMCYTENDYSTLNFLQWYVMEQREEETLARRAVELFELIGEDGVGLFMIDQEVGKLEAYAAKISGKLDS